MPHAVSVKAWEAYNRQFADQCVGTGNWLDKRFRKTPQFIEKWGKRSERTDKTRPFDEATSSFRELMESVSKNDDTDALSSNAAEPFVVVSRMRAWHLLKKETSSKPEKSSKSRSGTGMKRR